MCSIFNLMKSGRSRKTERIRKSRRRTSQGVAKGYATGDGTWLRRQRSRHRRAHRRWKAGRQGPMTVDGRSAARRLRSVLRRRPHHRSTRPHRFALRRPVRSTFHPRAVCVKLSRKMEIICSCAHVSVVKFHFGAWDM